MITDNFLAGFITGLIVGLIVVDLLWYSYWKHELGPLIGYMRSIKEERKTIKTETILTGDNHEEKT